MRPFPSRLAAALGLAALAGALLAHAGSPAGAGVAVSGPAFGDPLPTLPPPLQEDFAAGFALFTKVWSPAEGLGPLASAKSCATCHAMPMPGGSGMTPRTFVHRLPDAAEAPGAGVFPRFLVEHGGTLVERPLPPGLLLRKTPALFGIGLLADVPAAMLRERADPDDADGDGISGRLPVQGGQAGRFGWKGAVASVEDFVAVALASEMGITSEQALLAGAPAGPPFEVSAEDIARLSRYVRLLAAPPRTRILPQAEAGHGVFLRLGCEACHRETLRTAPAAGGPAAERTFHPYTDLLLHDMGPELADGLRDGGASGSEFRTPPLWGISSTGPPFLHDGRAHFLDEAILAHGGEASRAIAAFRQLAADERQALIDFLRSL
jgi:CxxC motif-containing protein (DUF1111 family)